MKRESSIVKSLELINLFGHLISDDLQGFVFESSRSFYFTAGQDDFFGAKLRNMNEAVVASHTAAVVTLLGFNS